MKTNISKSFSSYRELVLTGELQSTAEGEYLCLDVRGNITGDILVFICPKNKITTNNFDISELINSDNNLGQQRQIVFQLLKEKFNGLIFLPKSLVWLFSIGIAMLYAWWKSDSISALFNGKIYLNEILSIFPLIIAFVITPVLGRRMGFVLLKPLITIVMWVVRLIRFIRNRKVVESHTRN